MELHFDEASHTYTANGIIVPSVSEVIQAAGLTDYSSISPDVLEFARDRGTAVHKACELHDIGDLDWDGLDARIVQYVKAWVQFSKDHSPAWSHIEEPECNFGLKYAGTPDRKCAIKRKRVIVDMKATASLMPAVQVQLSGYDLLEPVTHDELWSVRLLPDGTYRKQVHKAAHSTFLSCLNIYNWKQRTKK